MLFNKRPRLIERLLLVEDEPLVAFDNEHGLKDAGYEVVATVDNVADALATIDEPLDLVLLDINLAGEGSGVDVARAAQARNLSVLLVTGNPPADAADYAVGCLAKPYGAGALRAALAAVDAVLGGDKPKDTPGLTLYDRMPD